MKILVLGGVKSGKSRFALEKAEGYPPPRLFVATAEAFDEEMAAKIKAHQRERGPGWHTMEAPVELPRILRSLPPASVVLIDCLTVWVGNLLFYKKDPQAYLQEFLEALKGIHAPWLIVSNEVGLGLLPGETEARHYLETLGYLNRRVAALCDEVYLLVAGCPLRLK